MLGFGREDEKHVKVFGRLISIHVEKGGRMTSYEVDPRHVEVLVEEFGLESSKAMSTPIVKDKHDEEAYRSSPLLGPEHATSYKSVVVRANYFAAGRRNIQFVCKELSQSMPAPREADWETRGKLGRYPRKRPRLVHSYWKTRFCRPATVCIDAHWPGNRRARKSTSCGCAVIGAHWVDAWSKTQHCKFAFSRVRTLCFSEGIGWSNWITAKC